MSAFQAQSIELEKVYMKTIGFGGIGFRLAQQIFSHQFPRVSERLKATID